MARGKQTRGKCVFCGREMTKGGLSRHLATCAERSQAVAKADLGGSQVEMLYHLQVQDAWDGDYWLHLEMRGAAKLKDLDHYLRAIWLECCEHLSRFSVGGWGGKEIAMSRKVEQVLAQDMTLTHIYDFGTSSETLVKMVGVRKGKPLTKHPIFLMARNDAPEETCIVCGQPAAWFCMACIVERDLSGMLCDDHAAEHPHHDYGEPSPLVNSPRVGLCGYEGPADPPY